MQLKTVTLLANTESERETKNRLLSLLREHQELEKWTFSEEVVIRDDGLSHSYPQLTLATNHLLKWNDEEFISVFVHENLHCFLSQNQPQFFAAVKELRLQFPKVPVGRTEGGARDEESTYIHLIVGYWEYVAMTQIFGRDSASHTLRSHTFYKGIYKIVLEETDALRNIMVKTGLTPIPD